jgi:hypothetical protein
VEAYSAGTGAGSEFVVRLPLVDTNSSEEIPPSQGAEDTNEPGKTRETRFDHHFSKPSDRKALKPFSKYSKRVRRLKIAGTSR